MTAPPPTPTSAPPSPPPPSRPLPRQRLLPVVVITLLVSLGVIAALVLPVVVRGLTPSVSAQERTVRLENDTATATLVLPAGWSWRSHFGDESRGVAGSPDRRMTVELSLVAGSDTRTALERIAPGPLGPTSEETLTDGPRGVGTILHAQVLDRDTVVGAVAEGPVILTFRSSPSPQYDAELADLLATVEVTR